MANPKPTKEQLATELSEFRISNANWANADERRRKEFAKAFGWMRASGTPSYSPGSYIAMDNRPDTPSWEQIWVQVGKLLVLEELKQKVILFPPIPTKDL